METKTCPFCTLDESRIIAQNDLVAAFFDLFPVNPGHTLIISKRHVANYFDLTNQEKSALWKMADYCKSIIDSKYSPNGYNIGINIDTVAGQSIHHVHMHLIPRYTGDTPNPRGGVRGVIPSKQNY